MKRRNDWQTLPDEQATIKSKENTMATLTATDTIDVLVIDGETVYEEQLASHIAEDVDQLQSWLEDWSDSFIYIAEDEDQHTEILSLLVLNLDAREVLFAGGIEVSTSVL